MDPYKAPTYLTSFAFSLCMMITSLVDANELSLGGAVGALAVLLDVLGDQGPHLVLLGELPHALIQLTQLVRAEGRKRVNKLLKVSAAHWGSWVPQSTRQHA